MLDAPSVDELVALNRYMKISRLPHEVRWDVHTCSVNILKGVSKYLQEGRVSSMYPAFQYQRTAAFQ